MLRYLANGLFPILGNQITLTLLMNSILVFVVIIDDILGQRQNRKLSLCNRSAINHSSRFKF